MQLLRFVVRLIGLSQQVGLPEIVARLWGLLMVGGPCSRNAQGTRKERKAASG